MSQFLCPTLKESPREAEVISHQLLLRAGYIRRQASGLYSYLPMGLKVLRKIEQIVRSEMDKSGGIELLLPSLTAAELWQKSGRWDKYGKELLRIQDRHQNEFCFGPTFEEAITDLVGSLVQSYKQLPLNVYQISTKFRDEVRPRFGLMRGREFVMKDAYSFHENTASLDDTFKSMQETYAQIFTRCGLDFREVEADSGAIGGSGSKEFMVTAETGEDAIVVCDHCDYAGNTEAAGIVYDTQAIDVSTLTDTPQLVETPGAKTIKDLATFLKVAESETVKTLLYLIDGEPLMILIRGDREVNDIKVATHFKTSRCDMVSATTFFDITGVNPGSAGPVNLKKTCPIYVDNSLSGYGYMTVGANQDGHHLTHVVAGRDFQVAGSGDFGVATIGDTCSQCQTGHYSEMRGIEVGHIFKLGDIYAEKMTATVLNEGGKSIDMIMGCYGIGVSRIMAAAIEQHHDDKGIVWPTALAPFRAVILIASIKDDALVSAADALYTTLTEAGVEVLLDDRKGSLGMKFKDAELMGIPTQVVVGKSVKNEGVFEVVDRKSGERKSLDTASVLTDLKS